MRTQRFASLLSGKVGLTNLSKEKLLEGVNLSSTRSNEIHFQMFE